MSRYRREEQRWKYCTSRPVCALVQLHPRQTAAALSLLSTICSSEVDSDKTNARLVLTISVFDTDQLIGLFSMNGTETGYATMSSVFFLYTQGGKVR